MTVWALLPVKRFDEAKSRLGAWLPDAQRADLARAMYQDTLAALTASAKIDRIAVVSGEAEAQAAAKHAGALCLEDPGPGLNAALEAGRSALLDRGASIVVVFPSDIPAMRPSDADEIVRVGQESRAAVIVPDHHGVGTNALLLHRTMPLRYAFGRASFQAHTCQARENGFPMRVVGLRAIECDCDTPEDVLRLTAVPPGNFTTRCLDGLKIASEGSMRRA